MSKNEEDLQIQIMKATPQLIQLWNKELERLHRTLASKELTDEDRKWVREQIVSLHKKLMGDCA
jgi:hypothetical protein